MTCAWPSHSYAWPRRSNPASERRCSLRSRNRPAAVARVCDVHQPRPEAGKLSHRRRAAVHVDPLLICNNLQGRHDFGSSGANERRAANVRTCRTIAMRPTCVVQNSARCGGTAPAPLPTTPAASRLSRAAASARAAPSPGATCVMRYTSVTAASAAIARAACSTSASAWPSASTSAGPAKITPGVATHTRAGGRAATAAGGGAARAACGAASAGPSSGAPTGAASVAPRLDVSK